jgi:hypothetical protein
MAGKLPGSAIQANTITSTQFSTQLGDVNGELKLRGSGISLNVANTAYFSGNVGIGITSPTSALHVVGNTLITQDLTVSGNLLIEGNTTTFNVQTLEIEDNDIVLNSNTTGVPSLNASITIDRGSSTNTFLRWNESADKWGWSDDGSIFYTFDTSLNAYAQANSAYDQANNGYTQANNAYIAANTAQFTSQNAYAQANSAYGQANLAYTQANSAYTQANSAYGQANSAYSQANSAYTQANSAYGQANSAYTQANSAYTQANSAYTQANSAYGQANLAYGQANSAYGQANLAYTAANNRVLTAGDTMTGQLNISSGGLLVTGNVGIGTANPGAQLDIKLTPANNNIYRATDSSNQYRWRVDQLFHMILTNSSGTDICKIGQDVSWFNQGNVGIGTANPGAKLQVESGEVRITSAGAINTHLNYQNGGDNYISHGNAGATYFRNSSATLMTILGSGTVGIGTTSPGYKLHVVGGITADGGAGETQLNLLNTTNRSYVFNSTTGFGFYNSTGSVYYSYYDRSANQWNFYNGGATATAVINSSGNVGIGLTTPQTKTHIVLNSLTGLVVDTVYGGGSGTAENYANAANTVNNVILRSSYSGSPETANNAGHKWGVMFTGYNGSTIPTSGKSAAVYAVSEDSGAGYNRAVGMSFWTSSFDANYTERVRITATGNVGIGTTIPQATLHLGANVDTSSDVTTTRFIIKQSSNDNEGGLYIERSGERKGYYMWLNPSAGSGDGLTFTRNNNGTVGDVFHLDRDGKALFVGGNVGIGTTSPGSTLSVRGSTNLGDSHDSSTSALHSTRISGYALRYDASTRYGSYGKLLFNGNTAWTTGARRWLITNGLNATKFAIIRSVDASTDPDIASDAGGISSGNADLVIDNAGNVGIGTTSPGHKLEVYGAATRLGLNQTQGGPTSTNVTANATLLLSGTGGNYLAFGQYGASQNFAQWIQSAYENPTTATYNLVLQPLGGNVGIGTANPGYKLDVSLPSTTSAIVQRWNSPSYDEVHLYIGSNQAYFGTFSGTPLVFRTNNTERLRIPSNAAGITFPAAQVASSDANTLDDYEEGTYTPTVVVSSGTPTYTYQEGYYTKIGRQVFGGGIIGISNSNALSGTVSVSVPFTIASSTYGFTGGAVSDGSGFTFPISNGFYSVFLQASPGNAHLDYIGVGTSAAAVSYTASGVGSSWYFRFNFSIRV